MDPITDEERRQEAATESLVRQITKEDPGYFDRLAYRIIAEFEAEGGSICAEIAGPFWLHVHHRAAR
jgi:hypothetical protein